MGKVKPQKMKSIKECAKQATLAACSIAAREKPIKALVRLKKPPVKMDLPQQTPAHAMVAHPAERIPPPNKNKKSKL